MKMNQALQAAKKLAKQTNEVCYVVNEDWVFSAHTLTEMQTPAFEFADYDMTVDPTGHVTTR